MTRRAAIRQETAAIAPYLSATDSDYVTTGVSAEVRLTPLPDVFPQNLESQLTRIVAEAVAPLRQSIDGAIIGYQRALGQEASQLEEEERSLREANADLIARNQSNVELEEVVKAHKRQEELLNKVTSKQKNLKELLATQDAQVEAIRTERAVLSKHIEEFAMRFRSSDRTLDGMEFGIEYEVTTEALQAVSQGFNRQENTPYFERSSELLKIESVLADPAAFLKSLRDGTQKVRIGSSLPHLAARALMIAPDVRFIATLEGDRIGGFERSSMTPGKQALFALSLMLNESDEAWPLLIDQPEDDLDSRSIFDTIVPYLVQRKRDRQILMVSHDANLVVGADSEQVVVANRHGNDRRNRDDKAFAYMTGSLEHTAPEVASDYVLESCGIREHACKILDGGETAFQKRRDKYKI